ncbi:MAG: glycosyltransferase [Bacteroidia bacterium]|nr:glycosyltransferase [Bacteroidia bacterium]
MYQPWTPSWVKRHFINYGSTDDIPEDVFQRIRQAFQKQYSREPLVSIVMIAHNEERTILRSLSSLSELNSSYPVELIVVNNNCSDRTQEILDRCGVHSVSQPIQGAGSARDAGIQMAKGKFHLCADADTIYPPGWVDEMIAPLEQGDAICTYGAVSFLPDGKLSRFTLSFYELIKSAVISLKAIRSPEWVAGGASMAFFTRMGKQIGWRTDLKRGEDSQMVLSMKRFGHIRQVTTEAARVWTSARTLDREGSFARVIVSRVRKELNKIHFSLTNSGQSA